MKLKRLKQEIKSANDFLDVVILKDGSFYEIVDVDYDLIQVEITTGRKVESQDEV